MYSGMLFSPDKRMFYEQVQQKASHWTFRIMI